jgi:hypothetical protein
MPVIIQDKKLTHYLLGDLSEAERVALEDLYLGDQDFFDRLLAVEEDLIDDYAQGRLSKRESRLFEENFLTSPERRDRVRAARALSRFVDAERVARVKSSLPERMLSYLRLGSTPLRFAVSAAMLVLFVGVAGMWIELNRMRSELAQVQSGQVAQLQREDGLSHELDEQRRASKQLDEQLRSERSERGQLQQEVAKLSEPHTEVFSDVLGFGVVERPRGGPPDESRKKIVVPRKAELVRLQLDLQKDEYPGYLVVLKNETEQEMWRAAVSSVRTAKGSAVVIRVPARVLKGGPYSLLLSGSTEAKTVETISEYPILVIKK